MAEEQFERTEPATPRRRQKFREKGQVAKSQEVNAVAVLVGVLLYFYFAGETIFERMNVLMGQNFKIAADVNLDINGMYSIIGTTIELFIELLFPLFIIIPVLSVLTNISQTGWLFTAKPLVPDLKRIDPISKFQQKFLSMKLWTDTAVNILKISALTSVIWWVIAGKYDGLTELMFMSPMLLTQTIMMDILEIMLKTILLFVVVAIADFAQQWYQLEKQMKMTKQEIRDEFKDMEGDPHMKGKMRSRMREISLNKMIDVVPEADMVITNPTHLAIAIRYKQGVDTAPKVLAKGKGFWAERIKAIARENNVEVIENKLLARSLYKSVKIGGEVPPQFYRAVAELLAYVYRLQQKVGSQPQTRQA